MPLPGGLPPSERDLVGYGRTPPDPRWPGGARLALSFVVNLEEGAELSLASGDERNESRHEVVEEVVGAPDSCMEMHFAYGARAGFWRVLDTFDAFGAKATFSSCARALAVTPALGAEPARRGHEVSAHGWRWERHAGMAEAQERAVIAGAVATMRAVLRHATSTPGIWIARRRDIAAHWLAHDQAATQVASGLPHSEDSLNA